MTMELSTEFKNKRQAFIDAVTNGESQEKQNDLYNDMLEALFEESKRQARQEVEELVAISPLDQKQTLRERAFFNDVKKDAPIGIEKLFPEETVDKIFEDMVQSRPLLQHLGVRNAGIRVKFLKSTRRGEAVWGKIFGEIKGQLEQEFDEEETIQHKLTAFVVIPKDAEKFGPGWIQSYVSSQITEAFAAALEAAFLNGDGNNKPIGLATKLSGTTSGGTTTHAAKDAQTTQLTFADSATVVKELTEVYKHHSTKEDGNPVAVEGNVVMVVNPADAWDVKKQYTSLNANGVYVTAMPYNLIIVESVAQAAGKVTTFVKGRYDAFVGGGIELSKFTETFALEDANLYTAKQFAFGKAHDEKAAAVWALKLPKK